MIYHTDEATYILEDDGTLDTVLTVTTGEGPNQCTWTERISQDIAAEYRFSDGFTEASFAHMCDDLLPSDILED